jgi:hypothetical protein
MSIGERQQGITYNGPSIAAVAELELQNFKLITNEQ